MTFQNQCPQCGQKLQRETLVRDYYNPSDFYGHSQDEVDCYTCTNDECDYQVEVEYV